MKRRLVHLVVCHTPNGAGVDSKIHEAWENRSRAQSRALDLAQEDARRTADVVPSKKTRIHDGASSLWTVQKMVHNKPVGRSEWVSLRTWTTQAVPLKDDVVERLAELVGNDGA